MARCQAVRESGEAAARQLVLAYVLRAVAARTPALLVLAVAITGLLLSITFLAAPSEFAHAKASSLLGQDPSLAWWPWVVALFVLTFALGVVAVLAGVGGGVLFVPIVAAFFPFHLDFVRGAGLFVALSGAIAAGPRLLGRGLASLRLGLPVGLVTSAFAIGGAMIGLALPTKVVQIALGVAILGVLVIMLVSRRSEFPHVEHADALSAALQINGIYHEGSTGQEIGWKIHRTPQGLALFSLVGVIAGMLGLGAGWANVPVLNLVMGVPLKVSVATSMFVLSITDTSAAWIYVNSGAILPVLVVPSVVGMMLGSMVGARILPRLRPRAVRSIVIAVLFIAGARALLQGLGQ